MSLILFKNNLLRHVLSSCWHDLISNRLCFETHALFQRLINIRRLNISLNDNVCKFVRRFFFLNDIVVWRKSLKISLSVDAFEWCLKLSLWILSWDVSWLIINEIEEVWRIDLIRREFECDSWKNWLKSINAMSDVLFGFEIFKKPHDRCVLVEEINISR